MENDTKSHTGVVICVLIVLALGAFWLLFLQSGPAADLSPGTPPPITKDEETTSPQPSGKIDEHLTIDNTLRDVNFCGKTYKVKQVFIGGVDVVQRVAELATESLIPKDIKDGIYAEEICQGVQDNNPEGIIEIEKVNFIQETEVGQKENRYMVLANGFLFVINVDTNEIYGVDGFDGSPIGPIGTLK